MSPIVLRAVRRLALRHSLDPCPADVAALILIRAGADALAEAEDAYEANRGAFRGYARKTVQRAVARAAIRLGLVQRRPKRLVRVRLILGGTS